MAANGTQIQVVSGSALGTQKVIDGYFDGYSAAIQAGTVTVMGGVTVQRQSAGTYLVTLTTPYVTHRGIQLTLCAQSAISLSLLVSAETISTTGTFKILCVNTSGTAVDPPAGGYISFMVMAVNSQFVPLPAVDVV